MLQLIIFDPYLLGTQKTQATVDLKLEQTISGYHIWQQNKQTNKNSSSLQCSP